MRSPDSKPIIDDRARNEHHGKAAVRFGILLILLSGVLWFSLFAIPFLPLSVGQRASLAGVTFVGVQIAWWFGAMLAGPQVVAKLWPKRGVKKTTD